MRCISAVSVVVFLVVCARAAYAAETPRLIPFQGHLTRPTVADPSKYEPVPSGQYDILFTLYEAPAGGESKVWGPERHAKVVVVNGLVNVLIGSVNGFNAQNAAGWGADNGASFFARPLYVGITIDADGNPATADLEMVPRQVWLPAVQALQSVNTDKLKEHDWSDLLVGRSNDPSASKIRADKVENTLVPPGTVVAFMGTADKVPSGWLLCDGSQIGRAQYAELFAMIGTANGLGDGSSTFNLPDLRGVFLRGVDGGRGVDMDRASRTADRAGANSGDNVGSVQGWATGLPRNQFATNNNGSHSHTGSTSAEGNHTHDFADYFYSESGGLDPNNRVGSGHSDYDNGPHQYFVHSTAGAGQHQHGISTTENGSHNHVIASGGDAESRPFNIYVNYIIKY